LGVLLVLALLAAGTWLAQSPRTEARAFQGTLRLGTQPIVQIDPAFISSDQEIAVANAVYDYLVDIDADNRIQPRLAESWTVSDDGLTYTFELHDNVTFHDGTAFTAADVVWTLNRLRDPDVGSGAADLFKNVVSVTAPDPLTVAIELSEPDPFFLFDLADNRVLIIKNGTTDPTDFNGTGPFRVVRYLPEDRIEMEANPDYFLEGMPQLARFKILFFPDTSAAVDALRGGQVDLVWRMPNAIFLSLRDEPGLESILVPTNAFIDIRLRTDMPPGDDPKVVKAFKLTIDRDELFNSVLLGLGAPGNDSPIGPLYKDYHAPATFTRDIDEAKRLLAQAGFPDGFEITLSTPDTLGMPDAAVLVKEQLADIGVTVNVQVRPENLYYGSNEWLDAPFGITSWGSRPVPQFYVDVMLVCDGRWNESRLCDSELDRWAKVAGTTLDESERIQAYSEIQRILRERGPLIIPYYFSQNAVIGDRFEGFQLKAFVGRSDLRMVRVKQ
jgi:peptide/nickel transport system substrate-binding protein